MTTKPPKPAREFGTRRPSVPVVTQSGPPAKRSGHVGLLLMGTLAGVEMGLELAAVPFRKGGVQAAAEYLVEAARKAQGDRRAA